MLFVSPQICKRKGELVSADAASRPPHHRSPPAPLHPRSRTPRSSPAAQGTSIIHTPVANKRRLSTIGYDGAGSGPPAPAPCSPRLFGPGLAGELQWRQVGVTEPPARCPAGPGGPRRAPALPRPSRPSPNYPSPPPPFESPARQKAPPRRARRFRPRRCCRRASRPASRPGIRPSSRSARPCRRPRPLARRRRSGSKQPR